LKYPITQFHQIPVFYHVPKNAGTYVSDWMLVAFRHYRRTYTDWINAFSLEQDSIKCLQITSNGFVIAKLLIGDPNYFCETLTVFHKKHSKTEWDIDVSNVTKELLASVFLFGVIIEARGFCSHTELINLVKNYNLYRFIILREPFSRAQSVYNYLTSNLSAHERTHGKIKSPTFEDYVLSEQLEDSWIIRNFNYVDNSTALNENLYQQTIKTLEQFHVFFIEYTDKGLQEVFLTCYGFDITQIKKREWDIFTKNETTNKKIKFEQLSLKAQTTFKTRTYWDERLFKTFIR
jgi:hypothetical protein